VPCPVNGQHGWSAQRPYWPLSGKEPGDVAIIHRTVRCAPDCPVSQPANGSRLRPTVGRNRRRPRGRHVARANGRRTAPDMSGVHRTVRCAPDCPVCQARRDGQRSARALKERNRALLDVRCAPDSPVHPRTEGNQGLPNEGATAPLALGAINRAPMRLYQIHKHTLSTLQLRDSATTLLNC
jgi:hypothetical protein